MIVVLEGLASWQCVGKRLEMKLGLNAESVGEGGWVISFIIHGNQRIWSPGLKFDRDFNFIIN